MKLDTNNHRLVASVTRGVKIKDNFQNRIFLNLRVIGDVICDFVFDRVFILNSSEATGHTKL